MKCKYFTIIFKSMHSKLNNKMFFGFNSQQKATKGK